MTALDLADEGATLVLSAVDRLVGDLADGRPALQTVGDALAALAEHLGVARVVVAIDDPQLGRQVFCSARRPLGDGGVGLFGPAGTWTEPPRTVDAVAAELLRRAVGVAVTRAGAPRPVPRAEPVTEPERTSATVDVEAAEAAPPVPAGSTLAPLSLTGTVASATARAVRHGWGFTLVLVRGGPGLTEGLRPRVRAADTLVAISDHELALVLPETAGDRVPEVLSRLAAGGAIPPFSYGLACCPADSRDPGVLARIASERLAEAVRVHALG